MERQERRWAQADGDLSDASGAEKQRPEPAQQPVSACQVRRPLPSTPQDEQLLLEQEILRDHRSDATTATQLRGKDGQVEQGEQEVPYARQRRSEIVHPGTLLESQIQAENCEFETHRRRCHSDERSAIRHSDRRTDGPDRWASLHF